MGKSGVTLPPETIQIYRAVFDTVLKANGDLNAIVVEAIKGKTGKERQKRKLKEINRLILKNEAFRDAVRLELGKQLASGEHRT